MASLQFFIDNVCANFTIQTLTQVVLDTLKAGPGTVDDIGRAVEEKDRSLDPKSARNLANAAVETLSQSGAVVVEGARVSLAQPATKR